MLDLTKMKAPEGEENLKDALGNFVYAQPDASLEPEALSKSSASRRKQPRKARQSLRS